MSTKQDVILAIGLHNRWINEFENAISNGWTLLSADLADRSSKSYLGSWLSACSTSLRNSMHFRIVQSLYADLHEAAAEVERIASRGNVRVAVECIDTGPYAKASKALTLALRYWMDAVSEDEYIHRLHTTQT